MLPLPWKTVAEPRADRDYVALLSFLPLRRYRAIPKFVRLTLATQRQLLESKGLVGYSLQAQLLRRQFWTLSAWENQLALLDFVRQTPHVEIMKTLAPHMGKTQFVRWNAKGTEIPLRWDQAKARMR